MAKTAIAKPVVRRWSSIVVGITITWCIAVVHASESQEAVAEVQSGPKLVYFEDKSRLGIKLPDGYVCTQGRERMWKLCEEQRVMPWQDMVAVVQPSHRFWTMLVICSTKPLAPIKLLPDVQGGSETEREQRALTAADEVIAQQNFEAVLLTVFQSGCDHENDIRRKLGWPTLAAVGLARPAILGGGTDEPSYAVGL